MEDYRVLYLGSTATHVTREVRDLEEPVRRLYTNKGIDCCASVRCQGLYLQFSDGTNQLFAVQKIHYCNAVSFDNPPLVALVTRRSVSNDVFDCHVLLCQRKSAAVTLCHRVIEQVMDQKQKSKMKFLRKI
jgi:Phosphotyrosine interaction domain (PTB/PID)